MFDRQEEFKDVMDPAEGLAWTNNNPEQPDLAERNLPI